MAALGQEKEKLSVEHTAVPENKSTQTVMGTCQKDTEGSLTQPPTGQIKDNLSIRINNNSNRIVTESL